VRLRGDGRWGAVEARFRRASCVSELPAAVGGPAARSQGRDLSGATATSPALVLEPVEPTREFLSALLHQEGFAVVAAASGRAAIEFAAIRDQELMVLDLDVSDIDGVDVCRRVRAFSDAHIVVLTYRTGDTAKVTAFEAGADDYVVKPFSVPELVARVRAARRRPRRRATPRD